LNNSLMVRLTLALSLLCSAFAGITFSRTIDKIGADESGTIVLAEGCTSTDKYGSNDCTLGWGMNNTVDVNAVLGEALTAKSKINYDIKVGLIPLKGSCAICGADCVFIIHIIKYNVTIALPPCPVSAQTFKTSAPFQVPDIKVPAPFKASGTATLTDDDGNVILQISAQGEATKAGISFTTSADGACTDTADQNIYNTKGKANFITDMTTCGKKCFGAKACVSTCMTAAEGYSKACADCFGDLGDCTEKNCLAQCINGNNPKCTACQQAKCAPAFTACSGLTPPTFA